MWHYLRHARKQSRSPSGVTIRQTVYALQKFNNAPAHSDSAAPRPVTPALPSQIRYRSLHSSHCPAARVTDEPEWPHRNYNGQERALPDSLGDQIPTPYGDDARWAKYVISKDGTPFTFKDAAEDSSSSSVTAEEQADIEALNAELFSTGFEGSPEETMSQALTRLGLSNTVHIIPGTNIKPLAHQVVGINWMLSQEGSVHRGGILADDMGLGKTIQAAGVILLNSGREGSDTGPTLFLTMPSLMQQTRDELLQFSSGRLKIYIYHGISKDLVDEKDLATFDIVISTVDTIRQELRAISDSKAKQDYFRGVMQARGLPDCLNEPWYQELNLRGVLHKTKWLRVIIDEAHNIRNRYTKNSRAVCFLDAKYRWCLTGTPVFNTLSDIYSLLRFLRIEPWGRDDWHLWKLRVEDEEKARTLVATQMVKGILKPVMLRRTKESRIYGRPLIDLPPLTIRDQLVTFSPTEQATYKSVEQDAQDELIGIEEEGQVRKKYMFLLERIIRLKQCATHYGLLPKASEVTIPLEHRSLSSSTRGPGRPSMKDIIHTKLSNPAPSSKLLALGEIVKARSPGTKIVIASQCVELLDLVKVYLASTLGVKCVMYTGQQNTAQRHKALEQFKKEGGADCLLLSITAGGAGLNITQANQLVLMDLAWNSAREQQCIGRLHRFGQKQEVVVTRLIVPDTIDERIIGLQQGKQRLSDETLSHDEEGGNKKKDTKKLGLEHWRFLFNLTKSGQRKGGDGNSNA